MAECKPVKDPCLSRGLTWFDWAYSIFSRICDIIAWLAGIFNNTRIAPYGKILLAVASKGYMGGIVGEKVFTVPAGAIEIHAIIDNEYAAANHIEIWDGAAWQPLPTGTDVHLNAITPMYLADVLGDNSRIGYGYYPQQKFKFPTGARCFVSAVYRETAPAITVVVT